jgi:Zn-dependent protease
MGLDFGYIITVMGVLLVSVSLHEFMHAFVSFRLGDDLAHSHGRISLNPLAHIDPFLTIGLPLMLLLIGAPPIFAAKPVPINTSRLRWDEFGFALVGLAGPLTNLVLAFIGGFALGFIDRGGALWDVARIFISVNVSLFVFNMLPIPPLDGSRLLYAVAPPQVQRIMEQIESFGILGLVMILLVLGRFISPIIDTMYDVVIRLVV